MNKVWIVVMTIGINSVSFGMFFDGGEGVETGDNKISLMAPSNAYTEVCFKDGEVKIDPHQGGETTQGGNCLPEKDVGFIIEQEERLEKDWANARLTCLNNGMRLPTVFEWQVACSYREDWFLKGMIGNWEWGSNRSYPMIINGNGGIVSAVLGHTGCHYATFQWVGYFSGTNEDAAFRCAR